ncbi:MAG: FkbM family methyltransferase, partial [Candidatus Nanopelagicales bacterium]
MSWPPLKPWDWSSFLSDFRESATARRQSWYGAKKYAKRLMALRVPHAVMQQTLRVAPSLRSSRLPAPAHVKEVVGVAAGRDFVMLRPDRCEIAKELYWGNGRRPSPADDFAIQFFAEVSKSADVVFDVG